MKKFTFRLERVLAWRQSQARMEEAALERLRAQIAALDRRRAELDLALREARDQLLGAASTTAAEIAALEHYRAAAGRKALELAGQRQAAALALARQTAVVGERRREAELLQRLRERRLADWRAEAARELEQQAEESHRARWLRERGPK